MRKLTVFLLALAMSVCLFSSVSAVSEPIDLNIRGSLSVTMSCSHGYKCGGNVALYHIATLEWTGTGFKFEYTENFKDCNIPLADLSDDLAAEDFNDYVIENEIVVDRNILYDGNTVFEDLPLGLYMVVHEDPTEGFTTALPFLVTVPVSDGDGWDYTVDASPKVELEHITGAVPPGIPQTGQLKWPIPVMAALGVLMFAIGWVLCFRKSKS